MDPFLTPFPKSDVENITTIVDYDVIIAEKN